MRPPTAPPTTPLSQAFLTSPSPLLELRDLEDEDEEVIGQEEVLPGVEKDIEQEEEEEEPYDIEWCILLGKKLIYSTQISSDCLVFDLEAFDANGCVQKVTDRLKKAADCVGYTVKSQSVLNFSMFKIGFLSSGYVL